MPRFEGTFHDSFPVAVPAERAAAWFADPRRVAEHYGALDEHTLLDPHTARFVLPEYSYGVTRFRGRYTCRYELVDPTTVRWSTPPSPDGNIDSTGVARFTRTSEHTCSLDYDARLALDIDVPKLLRRAIAPIAAQSVRKEMRAYVLRMISAVEAA